MLFLFDKCYEILLFLLFYYMDCIEVEASDQS